MFLAMVVLSQPGHPVQFVHARALRPQFCDVDGRWIADYAILHFAAMKAT